MALTILRKCSISISSLFVSYVWKLKQCFTSIILCDMASCTGLVNRYDCIVYGAIFVGVYRLKYHSKSEVLLYSCSLHRTLSSGRTPVFRHSAALINDLMIVTGGNGHNESSYSHAQECYSSEIQAYDIGGFRSSCVLIQGTERSL